MFTVPMLSSLRLLILSSGAATIMLLGEMSKPRLSISKYCGTPAKENVSGSSFCI